MFITKDNYTITDEEEMLWDTHDYNSKSTAIRSNPYFLCQTEMKYAKNIKRSFFKRKKNAIEYQKNFIKGISINDIKNSLSKITTDKEYFVLDIEKLQLIINEFYCL